MNGVNFLHSRQNGVPDFWLNSADDTSVLAFLKQPLYKVKAFFFPFSYSSWYRREVVGIVEVGL